MKSNMFWIMVITAFAGAAIFYVFKLDFEIGTGFSEEKRKAREAKYKVNKKDQNSSRKLLK